MKHIGLLVYAIFKHSLCNTAYYNIASIQNVKYRNIIKYICSYKKKITRSIVCTVCFDYVPSSELRMSLWIY